MELIQGIKKIIDISRNETRAQQKRQPELPFLLGGKEDYLIIAANSPLAYFAAIFSRSIGLILAAWPAQPKAS